MCLVIEHTITLLDDGAADGLGQMTFPRPWWPRKSASSRCPMKQPVARSWMSARFIFLLKSKSKLSSARLRLPRGGSVTLASDRRAAYSAKLRLGPIEVWFEQAMTVLRSASDAVVGRRPRRLWRRTPSIA